ncbi:helix-turn-helix domain-containing protein [uncultured Vibrio sp.]|uniref:helix-turn-helix domain-containing protein n=1 Tax=uncultured Vibrio sp. TaxID=114054 RepID=UPI0026137354|nr:helix-turn-helix domain-containing protein [uncultured Vibrio sp.]
MITTLELLNQLRVEKQLDSDRQVAKYLGLSQPSVQRWRHGGTMSDDIACEIAETLGLDVDFVLLAIIAERSKNGRAIEALERLTEDKKTA